MIWSTRTAVEIVAQSQGFFPLSKGKRLDRYKNVLLKDIPALPTAYNKRAVYKPNDMHRITRLPS